MGTRYELAQSILAKLEEPKGPLLLTAEREPVRGLLADVRELCELVLETFPVEAAADVLRDVLQPYQAQLGPEVHGAIAALEEALAEALAGEDGDDDGAA